MDDMEVRYLEKRYINLFSRVFNTFEPSMDELDEFEKVEAELEKAYEERKNDGAK